MSHVGGESSVFLITWKDATIPDQNAEQALSTWSAALYPYFQGFLPVAFRTRTVWPIKVSSPLSHVELMYYHHSPPLAFTGQSDMSSMRVLVGLMLREFQMVIEKVRDSNLIVKNLKKIEFKVVLGS